MHQPREVPAVRLLARTYLVLAGPLVEAADAEALARRCRDQGDSPATHLNDLGSRDESVS